MSADANQRYKQRWYRTGPKTRGVVTVSIPEDVERFEGVREPCFNCGERGGCRHRPWMLSR